MNPIHIYRTIQSAAGEQAPVLKRCLRDSVIAASLQGASFALLVPICLALGAGNNRAAVLWLLALTALLAGVPSTKPTTTPSSSATC